MVPGHRRYKYSRPSRVLIVAEVSASCIKICIYIQKIVPVTKEKRKYSKNKKKNLGSGFTSWVIFSFSFFNFFLIFFLHFFLLIINHQSAWEIVRSLVIGYIEEDEEDEDDEGGAEAAAAAAGGGGGDNKKDGEGGNAQDSGAPASNQKFRMAARKALLLPGTARVSLGGDTLVC